MINIDNIRLGIHGPLTEWLEFNRHGAFESPENLALAAPFPPKDRMHITTGLTDPKDFASHGYDILKALSDACPRPLSSFSDVLDFGVGAGRLARMFKGFQGRYTGIDVDGKNIAWVGSALKHVTAIQTKPKRKLPFADQSFDLIISVSVFSHMNERDQFFYLQQIVRIAKPGAIIMLTIHGERALQRAETEEKIFKMLVVSQKAFLRESHALKTKGFGFIRQWGGHLNSLLYPYGITFISDSYIKAKWAKYFEVKGIHHGAIHDFQDIVVLQARTI